MRPVPLGYFSDERSGRPRYGSAMRLRSLATPALILLLALPVFGVGCPQPEKEKPAATTDEKTKKSKGDDDDDDDKGAKKKKKKKKADEADDETTGDDDGAKKKPDDEAQGTVDGGHNEDAAAVAAVPIPAPCAPDPAGRLGAKPKLLTSGGEPGISIALWGKGTETPLSTLAVTIHADARCYVDYLPAPPTDPAAQWMGYDVPKGAVSAMTGVSERGAASFVGFRVTYHEPFRSGQELHTTSKALFYGYQNANGVPYSCGAIPGEKQCAMYQKPLLAQTGVACTVAKGGGPPDVLGQIKIGGTPVEIKKPAPGSTLIVVPTAIPLLLDAGAGDADGGTCNGPTCVTNAFMVKDKEHVYVRLSAGKPNACDAGTGPKVGDTWYFDESTWKKR